MYYNKMGVRRVGCAQAELALLLEDLRDRILEVCGEEITQRCRQLISRIINDLREYGKDYVRSKYPIGSWLHSAPSRSA